MRKLYVYIHIALYIVCSLEHRQFGRLRANFTFASTNHFNGHATALQCSLCSIFFAVYFFFFIIFYFFACKYFYFYLFYYIKFRNTHTSNTATLVMGIFLPKITNTHQTRIRHTDIFFSSSFYCFNARRNDMYTLIKTKTNEGKYRR